ncbi:hypothetical protein JW796_04205 [Candidatus Dojkabacteria bacterium]|nr:hypothetical protein [Candidatus Dojkabacteria bacterium]
MQNVSSERVISRRVVSSKVVGSANPIMKKLRETGQKAGGIIMAPIFIVIAIVLLFNSEKFQRTSEIISTLPLESANEVTDESGLHKITGVPEIEKPANAPQVEESLYYSYKKERYEQVEKKEIEKVTEVENGQEVEKTIETTKLVDEWVEKESETGWADFKLGKYKIATSGIELNANFDTEEYRLVEGLYSDLTTAYTPVLGDERLVVDYIKTDDNLIVVGEISQGKIASGDVFLLSNKTDAELISDLKTSESFIYWALKIGTWLLFTLAFTGILAPILALLDFIPLVGKAANFVAGVICAILSAILVLIGTLLIKFWWIILILFVILLVGLVVLVLSRKGEKAKV